MKKYYLLGAFALAFIFTACSIEKRHYMDGYHVEWNHKTQHATQNTATTAVSEGEANTVSSTAIAPVAPETVAAETVVTPLAAAPLVPAVTEENTNVSQTNSTVIAPAVAPQTKEVKKHTFMQKRVGNTDAPNADDEDTLILVLLCFFIPPLAVYFYEGNQWTNRCTVNLILTLLCGIPGIIHAFIVCFGGK